MRVPSASAQFAAQLPDLVENLAVATERLNTTIDRMERYMALADPMFRTMDRMLPQLEALIATGNDVYRGLSGLPGVATLSRLAGLSPGDRDEPNTAAPGPGPPKPTRVWQAEFAVVAATVRQHGPRLVEAEC